ncbi:MAG: efflux RND transporter permease subunit, partial [Candidatus Omnitrophota bacterium]
AMIPIAFLGITANESYNELYDLIDKRIADALRQIPGVGTVQLEGGLQRQINIWVDRHRLEGYGFSILDIQNILKKENVTQPVGNLKSGLTDYLIRLPGEFVHPDEINLVILGKRSGKVIYLKDVARVEDSFKEVTTEVKINKNLGLLLMIQKQTDTNTVEVAQRVKKKLKELEATLPPDVKMYFIFDTSKDIINSLNSLKSSLWFSIILVILVVWFFLRQVLPSFIIALTIPFSLLIAFVYMFLTGKTINTISLSSLAIASGMVVDNAIVVVDNVFRRLEKGNRPKEAAIFGTSEMFLAIAASTFTTMVVFLPMLFISGVVGILFAELAVIVTATLLASLFTATTFSPMLCSKWLKSRDSSSVSHRPQKLFSKFYELSEKWFKSWEEFYSRSLGWCLFHKKIVIFGFLGAFILSLFLTRFVGNEFIPNEDTGDLRLTVQLPIGTRLEETQKLSKIIEDMLSSDVPEARFYYARSGSVSGQGRVFNRTSGSNVVIAGVKLVPKDKRRRSVEEIGETLREKIQRIPGVIKTDISVGNPLGRLIAGTGGKAVQVEIIGYSFQETDALALKIKEMIEKIPGTVDTTISREHNRPELNIKIDREKIGALGLDMQTIASSLKTFIEGSTATRYRERGESYDIYVRLQESSRGKIEDIENLSIALPLLSEKTVLEPLENLASTTNSEIRQIKLSNIANIQEAKGPLEIERQNRERVVTVECNTYKRSMGKVVEDIKKELKNIVIPSDIMINIGGEAEEQKKAFKDLFLLLILGICLVYMVMAAQFESLLDPFIVMFSIPFTFIGVILGFILTGQTLSIISFLGVIMLMGIVVNNAIVLISYINILRARGLSMLEAVTLGGRERLRPVLMTTITTLVGLLPLAISRGEGSETWNPLGITMLGGLTVSTLITMLFVPTLYAAFEGRVRKNNKR